MDILQKIPEVRTTVAAWRNQNARIALVATMGNLHAGHLRLIDEAQQIADRIVVSIFINPLQFGANEDLADYPKTLAEDIRHLTRKGVDLLFAPEAGEIYPGDLKSQTRVEVPGLSTILCGAFRPHYFSGVTTVVTKLLNIVQPHSAVFGKKDYQQLIIIKRMVADLRIPVEIVAVETVREPDGLAMSSRNNYLSAPERERAPGLYQALCRARERLQGGECDWSMVESDGMRELQTAGLQPEYFCIRTAAGLQIPDRISPAPDDLEQPDDSGHVVILAAAWLGKARLIDNVPVIR